jgi:hypothetical protein
MVCVAFDTFMFCVTLAAAAYDAFPVCDAWILQVPPLSIVSVVPLTEQIDGVVDANDTGRPDVADAISVNGGEPKGRAAGAGKSMLWAASLMVIAKLCEAFGAMPLLAVSCPANVPAALGVPLIKPVALLMPRPVGKALPAAA